MSETRSPGGGRYQRSSGGLVGAMVVTVVAVVAFVALRAFTTDNDPTPRPVGGLPGDGAGRSGRPEAAA